MTESKGKIIIGIIILLVLVMKFGGVFTQSIYSGDANYIAYSTSASSYTLSSNAQIYSFCSPSRVRIDFHSQGTTGTCQQIFKAPDALLSISAVCNLAGCPDFRDGTIVADQLFSQLYSDGMSSNFIITDSVNEVVLYTYLKAANADFLKNDVRVSYDPVSNSFNVSDRSGSSRRLASNLDESQPFRFKISLSRSGGQYGYAQAGHFYKYDDTVSAPTATNLPPPVLSVTGTTSTSTSLSWTSSAGATSYYVKSSTTTGYTNTVDISPGITTTTYTITGLSPSTTYYYFVSAQSAQDGSNSNVVTVTTPSGSSCTSQWSCSAWSACQTNGQQTRTCTDANVCSPSNPANPNTVTQSCVYTPPTCNADHVQGDLVSTQCGSSSTLNQTTWNCNGATWTTQDSLYGVCSSGYQCVGTASSCTAIPSSQTPPPPPPEVVSSFTPTPTTTTEPVPVPTAPAEKNYVPLLAVLAIGGALILRARKR